MSDRISWIQALMRVEAGGQRIGIGRRVVETLGIDEPQPVALSRLNDVTHVIILLSMFTSFLLPATHLAERIARSGGLLPDLPLLTGAAVLMICGIQCRRDQGMGSRRCRAAAAVWTGDDLQQVAVRIIEIDPTPTIPGIDLVTLVAVGVRPIGKVPLTNPREDLIEFNLDYKKGIVLRRDLVLGVVDIV